jgi:hypothetical protein
MERMAWADTVPLNNKSSNCRLIQLSLAHPPLKETLKLENQCDSLQDSPAMNILKLISAASFAFAILSAPVLAESCCDKAKAAGKACSHPCCVEAKAKGEVCKKCNK